VVMMVGAGHIFREKRGPCIVRGDMAGLAAELQGKINYEMWLKLQRLMWLA
jgi:hypothetical protein